VGKKWLTCPYVDQRLLKNVSVKKRKRNNGEGQEITEAKAKVGTRNEYFLRFITGVMDILDKHRIKGHYLVMSNATVHKVPDVQKLIADRGYKAMYMPPYSSFLNPIELFWLKVNSGVKKYCLTATDNLSSIIIESAGKVTIEDCKSWIQHSSSFFDRCSALEPMLWIRKIKHRKLVASKSIVFSAPYVQRKNRHFQTTVPNNKRYY
jgi:transposase